MTDVSPNLDGLTAATSTNGHLTPPSAGRSRNMRAVKRVNTKPEIAVRSKLHRKGYRFRKDYLLRLPNIKVRPDIVFTRTKVAVFIDGCFWHVCPIHGRIPTVNGAYWVPKLTRNVERARSADEALVTEGWKVIHIWEHTDLDEAIRKIEHTFDSRAATDRVQ